MKAWIENLRSGLCSSCFSSVFPAEVNPALPRTVQRVHACIWLSLSIHAHSPASYSHRFTRKNHNATFIPHCKCSFLWAPDKRGRKERVCSRTTMPGERIQLLLRLVVSGTNNWAVPLPWWFHKLIAYYVARQGEITVFLPYLTYFLFHILENILRQFSNAQISVKLAL